MATIEALPAVVASLGAALTSLPTALTSVNTTLLSSLLSGLSSDLTPLLPTLAAAQQEALLTNSTFLASQLSQLGAVTAQIPPGAVNGATADDLVALIEFGSTKYSIFTFWAPEVWAIVIAYGIAAALKVALTVMLRRSALKRAGAVAKAQGRSEDREANRAAVMKPAKAALGHALNLVVSTIVLILQLMAWRLFVLPSAHVRMSDIRFILIAIKTLLVGYAADLLFGDLRPEIFVHHFFTLALLFVGQLAAFETKSPNFVRFAQYLLLQATTEQTTYVSMVAYHGYSYLRVQDARPRLQERLLKITYRLLRFTRWITFPQKLVPCAFAVYWHARMWTEIDGIAWGRAWIVWCTMIVLLLTILQVKFCDDVFPLANYIGYKIYGGPTPSRTGPVMRTLYRLVGRGSRKSRSPTVDNDKGANELSELEKGNSDSTLDKQKDEGASWESVSDADSRSRSNTLLDSLPQLEQMSEVTSSTASDPTRA